MRTRVRRTCLLWPLLLILTTVSASLFEWITAGVYRNAVLPIALSIGGGLGLGWLQDGASQRGVSRRGVFAASVLPPSFADGVLLITQAGKSRWLLAAGLYMVTVQVLLLAYAVWVYKQTQGHPR